MSITEAKKWHARLGHIGKDSMSTMIKRDLVIGIPKISVEKETCSSCVLGKKTRHVFPKASSYRASSVHELIHGDLCGPITPSTPSKKRYIFVLIDDHSRYMWSILLMEKSEALGRIKFKEMRSLIGVQDLKNEEFKLKGENVDKLE